MFGFSKTLTSLTSAHLEERSCVAALGGESRRENFAERDRAKVAELFGEKWRISLIRIIGACVCLCGITARLTESPTDRDSVTF